MGKARVFLADCYNGEHGLLGQVVAFWVKFVIEACITVGIPLAIVIHVFPQDFNAIIAAIPKSPDRELAAWLVFVTGAWVLSDRFYCFSTSR